MKKSNKDKYAKVFILLALIFVITVSLNADDLTAYSLISENEYLKLFINNDTTEIAVQDKNNQQVWYSNPSDIDEMETIARGTAREELHSQVLLSFYLPGNRHRYMNNYSDSIVFDQFEINEIDDGVSIDYIIGEQWSDDDFVPTIIAKSDFENKILSNLSEEESSFLLEQYHLLAIKERENDQEGLDIPRFNREEVISDYIFMTLEEDLNEKDMR
ncbi:MAG: hypothetical protein ACOCRK_08570, partial [bacterium]